ncbi:hypothetical protein CYLTODRAFT_389056 [Cylindrobasidium torrendii FP15055 ss-10]|uniref:Peptidase C14 caspase domain-containing protein n=1 Tax=Cylindrobasidium torrendii FP15055 ss-10 TaxID=1314674 RepID=A0A0D7BPT6_9AGAR|nr:hypothetical protein CYLTODRAFT_389056 [Cylindrobasidium torrendii FP15055 ss-10]
MCVSTKQSHLKATRIVEQTVQHTAEGELSGADPPPLAGHPSHADALDDVHTTFNNDRDQEYLSRPLFALTIGINEYKHSCRELPNLKGCIPDADEVDAYLERDLRVPKSNIVRLRNSDATRANIIKAIRSLSSNERIQENDAIVIYYAGHGAETKRPPNWPGTNANIQMILPHDFELSTTQRKEGQGILDINLSRLLGKLALKKGNNITVIMDCCHSGSGTRGAPACGVESHGSDRRARLPEDYEVLSSLYKPQRDDQNMLMASLNSHVLLAATSCTGLAREKDGRGAFTSALLGFLRNHPGLRISWKEVIQRLPKLATQNPQCEGNHSSRMPFRLQNAIDHPYFCVTKEGDHYRLHAGELQGIRAGVAVDLYERDDTDTFVFWSTTKVSCVTGASQSFLDEPVHLVSSEKPATQLWALKTLTREITVALRKKTFWRLVDEIAQPAKERPNVIKLVDIGQPCDLSLCLYSKHHHTYAWFDIADTKYRDLGARRLVYAVPFYASVITQVLNSAADFFYNLRKENIHHPLAHIQPQHNSVLLEAYALREAQRPRVEHSMITSGANININGVMKVNAGHHGTYGFRIVNKSNNALYCWAFFFEMSDLCIWPLFTPSCAEDSKSADPSIQPGQDLTIGYGSGGAEPLRITPDRTHNPIPKAYLYDDTKVDVSYLKIFLTTQYVDLAYMEQLTPFFTPPKTRRGRQVSAPKAMPIDVWDTLTLAVISSRE